MCDENFHVRYAHTATCFANTLEYCNNSSLCPRAPVVAVTGGGGESPYGEDVEKSTGAIICMYRS